MPRLKRTAIPPAIPTAGESLVIVDNEVLRAGFVGVQQAAKMLDISVATIYRIMERGELPYLSLAQPRRGKTPPVSGARRIPVKFLRDFIQARMRGGWDLER